jgi:nucleoporin NUP82
MRFSSLKLPLRIDSVVSDAPDAPLQAIDNNRYLAPLSDSPAYVSLLADDSYTPPPALTQRSAGLASTQRFPTSLQGEFMLTPETLRRLGTVIEEFTTRIHAIQLGYRGSEVRRELQIKEFKRQQDTCRELLELVEKLKGRRSGLTQYKLNTVTKAQESLMRRFDRVLQKLMEQASPELSVYETKWFQELRRMKEDIVGIKKFDDSSLVARTNLVSF